MELSKRVNDMSFSPIRKFNVYARKAEENGRKIYRLNIGQPDIKTPPCFLEAIRNFDDEIISYAESEGISDLLDAIIEYFRLYDIDYEKDDVIVTTGGSEALTMIFTAILNRDDEVIIPEPFYANYATFINSSGGKIKAIKTKAAEGFRYAKREMIEPLINEKTKAILITNPGNPTGTILSAEEMKLIVDIAIEHDIFVIADEVYREFAYDGRKAISFGSFEEGKNNIVIVDSVSKRFSACGARIGCVSTKNKLLSEGILKLAQGRLSVSTLDQVGAAALYRMDPSYYEEVKKEYENRRDAAYEEIMKIPGVICEKPGGAFYMTVKLPIDDCEDFLMFLLTEFEDNGETVMFAPGNGFYIGDFGSDRIRLAYVLNSDDMRRGAQLISLGLDAYKNKKNIK